MTNRPGMFYSSVVIAAVSVTLLSLAGTAALTGHLPASTAAGATQAQVAAPTPPAMPPQRVPAWTEASAATSRPTGRAAVACATCGVVESVRVVQRQGPGTGLGAVAGGVLGAVVGNQFGRGNGRAAMTVLGAGGGAYVGNEVEKDARRSTGYQIRVRLDNGTTRVLYEHERPGVNSGDRVRIVDGHVVMAG